MGFPLVLGMEGRVLRALGGHSAHPCASPGVGRLRGKPRACPLPTGVPSQQRRQGEGRAHMEDSTMDRTPPLPGSMPQHPSSRSPVLAPCPSPSPPCPPSLQCSCPIFLPGTNSPAQQCRPRPLSRISERPVPSKPPPRPADWHLHPSSRLQSAISLPSSPCCPGQTGQGQCLPRLCTRAHPVTPGRATALAAVWVRTPAALGRAAAHLATQHGLQGSPGPNPSPTRHPGNVCRLDRAPGCSDGRQVGLPC